MASSGSSEDVLPERVRAALVAATSLADRLDLVIAEARRLTGAEAGTLSLRDGDSLVPRIVHNDLVANRPAAPAAASSVPPVAVRTADVSAWVLETGQTVNVADVYRLPDGTPFRFDRTRDVQLRYRTRSLVAVPIVVAGEPVGVLELVNARDARGEIVPFQAWHEPIVETLARCAGDALVTASAEAVGPPVITGTPAASAPTAPSVPAGPSGSVHPVGRRLGELATQYGLVAPVDLDASLAEQRRTGEKLGVVLVRRRLITEHQLAFFLSLQFKVPAMTLDRVVVEPETLALVPRDIATKHEVVVLQRGRDSLLVAMADPNKGAAIEDIRFRTGLGVLPVVAPLSAVRALIERLYGGPVAGNEAIDETDLDQIEIVEGVDVQGPLDLLELRTSADDPPVVRLVNGLFRDAIRRRASDIHLEPFDSTFRVRFRVDGVLRPVMTRPRRLEAPIVSRIKIMANLDIAERRRPQDGHVKIRYEGREVDLRIGILPTRFGEAVNIRILDRKQVDLDPVTLGFDPWGMARLAEALAAPHGLVLMTGPTGSGKTTTLYSALQRLNTEGTKILTVEDPIEYGLEGINQVEINEAIGRTFASTLRAFLRHDPDIIFVGEMRDLETAQVAVRAGLTGHLVLSSLHTNDGPSTLVRLLDLGIPPFLVAASVRIVVAQRLVRRVCRSCRVPCEVDGDSLVQYGYPVVSSGGHTVYRGRGCAACDGTGMTGRTGLYQVMPMSDELRALIVERPHAVDLEKVARQQGMKTLREIGLARVFEGVTTLDEVLRVTAD